MLIKNKKIFRICNNLKGLCVNTVKGIKGYDDFTVFRFGGLH